jgi:hypothetical protein
LKYISNIYVIKDPSNPDNEGKVFLYSYGKKIFDKLNDLMRPQFEDEAEVNPFDLWEGANFKLKIRQVEGYTNYDKSEFESVSPLSTDDDEMETVYNKQYSLEEFTGTEAFKTYDQLKELRQTHVFITTLDFRVLEFVNCFFHLYNIITLQYMY